MGRRERELDPAAGPVQRFALELRQLRESAGRPSYRDLSRRAHYSVTTLSEAAGGVTVPSLAVTLAYVAACGGDADTWEARWRAVMDEVAADSVAGDDPATSPYLGLASFEPRHAEWFFGRQELVDELSTRLARDSFVAVFGASGSGKSSLLRAGLVPAVRASRDGWRTIVLTPGPHPVEELAAHLAGPLGLTAAAVRDELAGEAGPLWRQLLATGQGDAKVLVVVDQFEEIFTLCGDAEERQAFVTCLVAATQGQNDRVKVVLGVRADFFARCAQYPELVAALRDRQVLVGPMAAGDLRCVVREPALLAGMKVETALVEAVVADADGEPGALPLVSHALFETWKRRSGNTMTLAAYRTVGGVQGAIAQTAEAVYAQLEEHERTLAKNVFLRLVALGQGTEDTRRRVTRAELLGGADEAAVTTVLARLAAARLVTLGEDTVEVAHEALIRSWPRLRDWLTEDREELAAHRRLTETAAEWAKHDRDDGLLYRGVRLAEWDGKDAGRLNELEHEFLDASRDRARAERTAARRRVRLAVSGLAAAVVALTVLTSVAFVQARRAEDGQQLAFSRQLVASARGQFQLDPELGLLLARRAYEVNATEETEAALRQATFESRIRAVVESHDGIITGVSFTPDGRHVATSGGDGAIRVWKYGRTLTDPVELKAHTDYVWTPVFSPDGRRVVAASLDGTVSVWEWGSDEEPVILKGHEDRVWSATFSPDGTRVVSVGDDGTVRIWDATGAGSPVVLDEHDGRTLGVAFSPDGRQLAVSGGDKTVRIWDVATWQTVTVLRGHENSVEALAYRPDGQRIATASTDGTVRLWDPAKPNDPVLLGTHEDTAEGVAYSHDGTRVASVGNDGTVRVWNPEHGGAPLILRGHRATVIQAAFSPDDRRLVSVAEDGTARVWDVAPLGSDTVLKGHDGAAWAVVPNHDGSLLASAGTDGKIRVWNPEVSEPVAVLEGHVRDVLGLAFSQDGRLIVSGGDDGTVRVWAVGTWQQQAVWEGHEGEVWTAAFSPDGTRVVSGGTDGTVRIWSVDGKTKPRVIETDGGWVRFVAYSPVGDQVATASQDGTVQVMDSRGGNRKVLGSHQAVAWAVSFSPDGRRLVSGGNDNTARIWELDGSGRQRVLTGHQGIVWYATFSPDGRFVATSGNDATIRIWPADHAGAPLVLHGFGASVESANFLSSNTRFVSSHNDGTVRVWDCRPCAPMDQVVRQAGEHVTRDLTQDERAVYLNEPTRENS